MMLNKKSVAERMRDTLNTTNSATMRYILQKEMIKKGLLQKQENINLTVDYSKAKPKIQELDKMIQNLGKGVK